MGTGRTLAVLRRLLPHYRAGVVSTAELVNDIVASLVAEDLLEDVALVLRLLRSDETPYEIRERFSCTMEDICHAGFSWTPFTIGAKSGPADPNRLRQIYELMVGLRDKPG